MWTGRVVLWESCGKVGVVGEQMDQSGQSQLIMHQLVTALLTSGCLNQKVANDLLPLQLRLMSRKEEHRQVTRMQLFFANILHDAFGQPVPNTENGVLDDQGKATKVKYRHHPFVHRSHVAQLDNKASRAQPQVTLEDVAICRRVDM